MRVGYARSIRSHPDISSQIEALRQAGCQQIFTESQLESRRRFNGLESMFGYLQPGDSLVVCRLACLARSFTRFLRIVARLNEMQLTFKSLHEDIDTTGDDGSHLYYLFDALHEFNRALNHE